MANFTVLLVPPLQLYLLSTSTTLSPPTAAAAAAAAATSNGPPEYRHSLLWTWAFVLAYALVFLVGMVGNSCVVLVICRTRSMRTVTNLFILNLAVADLLVIIFCIPATLLSNIFVPWLLGWYMCKFINYVQGVSVCASVYSLVAVSLDKLFGIWYPMRKTFARRRAQFAITVIWLLSALIIGPWAFVFDLITITDVGHVVYCVEVWPTGLSGKAYFLVGNLILCYLLPLAGITLCYVLIWWKVLKRQIPIAAASVDHLKKIHRKAKIGVLKMLMVVILVFSLSWLPLYLIFTRVKFANPLQPWEENVYAVATPIAQWLGSSNSCINPILYTFLNARFRRAFINISSCSNKSSSPSSRSRFSSPMLTRRQAVKRGEYQQGSNGCSRVKKHVSFTGITAISNV